MKTPRNISISAIRVLILMLIFAICIMSAGAGMAQIGEILASEVINSGPEEEWNRTLGGVNDEEAYSYQQTTDGGYMISGSNDSYGAGGFDFYLVKTDSSGIKEWDRIFVGDDNDNANSVQQVFDDGYNISPSFTSNPMGFLDNSCCLARQFRFIGYRLFQFLILPT